MKVEAIPYKTEWDMSTLSRFEAEIGSLATEYGLQTYPIQIEIINAKQMLESYCAVGMPMNYHHWSFGKSYLSAEKSYRHGHLNLAYEVVINSDPCIAYLMEESSLTMQAVVIAHACYGHNAFFKNNYLFTTWTDADQILPYLDFAKHYIAECEERYGLDAVEATLDACHALAHHGVDRYQRTQKPSLKMEAEQLELREAYLQTHVNEIWSTLPSSKNNHHKRRQQTQEPQENLLFFIEKNAPNLAPWQREIIRIVRSISQYFYPQRQTKVMNEGWASFWHYTLINQLYERGIIGDQYMMEFIKIHTDVVSQLAFDDPRYNGINPYYLGFQIFSDLKRICQNPTDEDKAYFPDYAGANWIETLDFAMRNYKDESFISQYLSPKTIRDMKLFSICDDENKSELLVTAIHNDEGYEQIRRALSKQYDLSYLDPNIQVHSVNFDGDRSIMLCHIQSDSLKLADTTPRVLEHLYYLWGFPVHLETLDSNGNLLRSYHFPEKPTINITDIAA